MVNPLTLVIAKAEPVAIHCITVNELLTRSLFKIQWLAASVTSCPPRNDKKVRTYLFSFSGIFSISKVLAS